VFLDLTAELQRQGVTKKVAGLDFASADTALAAVNVPLDGYPSIVIAPEFTGEHRRGRWPRVDAGAER
jgi:hypothetical protein